MAFWQGLFMGAACISFVWFVGCFSKRQYLQAAVYLTLAIASIFCADSSSAKEVTGISQTPLESKVEYRYCGIPKRDSNNKLLRDASVVTAFRNIHPCPANGSTHGSCPGWAVDHVIPLDCGGCDAVSNMQWLPNEIKSAAGKTPKDRWERAVYANEAVYKSSTCKFKIVE